MILKLQGYRVLLYLQSLSLHDPQVGVAVFPDPRVNAPYWGVADYGTLTVNPLFYQPWELGVGDFVETGIRLVVHDGSPYEARIADLYDDFSFSIKNRRLN